MLEHKREEVFVSFNIESMKPPSINISGNTKESYSPHSKRLKHFHQKAAQVYAEVSPKRSFPGILRTRAYYNKPYLTIYETFLH